MKRSEDRQTAVWRSDAGSSMLKMDLTAKPADQFLVMTAACSPEELAELGEAIADALKLVAANQQKPEVTDGQ
jgi:hypothetical protein